MSQLRIVGRIRLSRDTDASTSVERQREAIEGWAKMHDGQIVGWATDVDVSGAVSPLEAPELSQWLQQPESWDVLVAAALDRLGRTLFGLNDLFAWANENKKVIATIRESINLDTWSGRMVASVLAGVAEGELEAIKARTKASRAKLVELGRWHGGALPYGYRSVKAPDGDGYRLEPDPEQAAIVREIFERVADNWAVNKIVRDLNDRGVKPPRKGSAQWNGLTIKRMVSGTSILGQQKHHGKLVLGPDGMPVQFGEPLVSDDLYRTANAVLASNKVPRKRSNPSGLLLNVVYCWECYVTREELSPLYLNVQHRPNRKRQEYRYWRCREVVTSSGKCTMRSLPADELEEMFREDFLGKIGHTEVTESVWVPGTDTADELEKVNRAISRVRKEADSGLYDDDEEGYLERLKRLTDRRRELESLPSTEGHWEDRPTGETYREAWDRMDTDERRHLIQKTRLRGFAKPNPLTLMTVMSPPRFREALPGWTHVQEQGVFRTHPDGTREQLPDDFFLKNLGR
ncbi:recombinase family protein [Saccharomonospora glauca]|uniref:Site-specific recombinase, DNA invertase Pin n=1 Tax=Saccharomonospora glauca K62 TaxID=928724 RepID=I1CZH0_9PSEU|nr:recombinase family protein [Saccharomonospora glauca]EIE98094.1 site-specific recombinase, DNA invertase Pin [Saccharomonospora glauca K62]